MKRYCIPIEYDFHGEAIGVEEDPEGDWYKVSDVDQKPNNMREYLLEDIKHLSDHDVGKLYKYVRRYLVANIEGLVDPLEPKKKTLEKKDEKYDSEKI